jgi:hypothetical protein
LAVSPFAAAKLSRFADFTGAGARSFYLGDHVGDILLAVALLPAEPFEHRQITFDSAEFG